MFSPLVFWHFAFLPAPLSCAVQSFDVAALKCRVGSMQTGLKKLRVISRVERGLVWGSKDSPPGLVRDKLLAGRVEQETGCPGSPSAVTCDRTPLGKPTCSQRAQTSHKHILQQYQRPAESHGVL